MNDSQSTDDNQYDVICTQRCKLVEMVELFGAVQLR